MTLTWTTLSVATAGQWADLTNVLAEVDGTEEYYEAADLAEELGEPGFDPGLDTVAVFQDSAMVAYGQLRVRGINDGRVRTQLDGGVHPDHRGRGLGRQIMQRLEDRALALAAQRHPGVDVQFRTSGGLPGASVRPLLEHRGYEIIRYFHQMQRPLPGAELPEPPPAEVVPWREEFTESARLAYNDSFATHFGSTPIDAEHWQGIVGSRTFRPACSAVVLGPDGEVQSFVLVCQWVAGEAAVELVGTRQDARGRGLARASLTAALRTAVEQGYTRAVLDVDSESGQGAGTLYASLGFEVTRVFASYARVVPAA